MQKLECGNYIYTSGSQPVAHGPKVARLAYKNGPQHLNELRKIYVKIDNLDMIEYIILFYYKLFYLDVNKSHQTFFIESVIIILYAFS